MSDEHRYLGHNGERLRWVEQAIGTTHKWIKDTRDSAFEEIIFSRPGEYDYDAATDEGLAVKKAETTLKALEAEKAEILAGQARMQHDIEQGNYEAER